MRNIRLVVEYDGTGYAGWQKQEKDRTVQGEIEGVLLRVLQETVNVLGAGRTDAGTHARGQVANFRTESILGAGEIRDALNALLPEDIVVRHADEVPLDFHARYSARERTYSYLVTLKPSALLRNFSWHVKYGLDITRMEKAAEGILGSRDFGSFCKGALEVEHHDCIVTHSAWSYGDSTLRYEIRANRFLHGMVRALVGTMVNIGRGYTTLEEFSAILGAKDRSEAGMAAPAKGLVLESVSYEGSA